MTTDWKALCAGLLDALDSGIPAGRIRMSPLAESARAALAEPEPEGPTDEELLEAVRHLYGDQTAADMGAADDLLTARALLARWGNS